MLKTFDLKIDLDYLVQKASRLLRFNKDPHIMLCKIKSWIDCQVFIFVNRVKITGIKTTPIFCFITLIEESPQWS